ncbi:MAG: WD40 repeat domain-containing protein, partial [Trichormus sp.]
RTLPSLREAAPTERYANTRHSNRVTSLAISPDGKILASGSSDDTIKLWNLATGEQIRTLGVVYPERYYNSVTAIPISPSVAAIGSSDNTIKLWNLATGEQIRTLPSLREAAPTERYVNTRHYNSVACQCQFRIPSVTSIAISPDGKTLASVSEFGTITLWNLATGEQIRTLAGHSGDVDSVAISPDGKILVSGGIWDKTIKLWNLTTGEEIRTLTEHSEGVTSVAISPDGKTLVSGSRDKTIKIWRLE